MKSFLSGLVVLGLMAGAVSAAGFDEPKGWDSMTEGPLKTTFYTGIFQGRDVATGVLSPDLETNKIKTDDGLMLGLRLGRESTYWGWELGFAGVFADEKVSNIDGVSTGDARWYLFNADLMLFPFGDNMASGTLRPFVCAGPGVAYYASDNDVLDSKAMFDLNLGVGTSITISESLPDLRVDYRWHFMGSSEYDRGCYKELSIGICFEF